MADEVALNSSAVRLELTASAGRGVVAAHAIAPGDECLRSGVDAAYAMDEHWRAVRCHRCLCPFEGEGDDGDNGDDGDDDDDDDDESADGTDSASGGGDGAPCTACGQRTCAACATVAGAHDPRLCALLASLGGGASGSVVLLGTLLLRGPAACAKLQGALVGHDGDTDPAIADGYRAFARGMAEAVTALEAAEAAAAAAAPAEAGPKRKRAKSAIAQAAAAGARGAGPWRWWCAAGALGAATCEAAAFALLCRVGSNAHALVEHGASGERVLGVILDPGSALDHLRIL
jgi:hypothetical protein